MRLTFVVIAALVLGYQASQAATNLVSATLEFDPSPSPEVVGYRLYWGVQSRTYTNALAVGNQFTVVVSNLVRGVKYYFAVTAYDGYGAESPFSNEARFPVPVTNYVIIGFTTNGVIAFQGIYTNPAGDVVLFTPFIWQTNNNVSVVRLDARTLRVNNTNAP